MQYFTEERNDIEGYRKSLLKLEKRLDSETFDFIREHSFHDSVINKIILKNDQDEKQRAEQGKSIVSVSMQLTYWDDALYELRWENATVYSLDFNISRNKTAENERVLFEEGLDQWSHDELSLADNGRLKHEIYLFSHTTILIECEKFSIHPVSR